MARGNQKQAERDNHSWLSVNNTVMLAVNGLVVLYHLFVSGELASLSTFCSIAFFAGQEWLALMLLRKAAEPVRDGEGTIAECKSLKDTKTLSAMESFCIDMLWTCEGVQLLLLLTSWAWLIYLFVPVVGAYKLWHLVQPLLSAMGASNVAAGADEPAGGGRHRSGSQYGESRKDRRQREIQERKDARVSGKDVRKGRR
eukprot:TRINITY_DN51289_c0_g1_i1.p2 TRINITY_DN51289_c0_g1~~TRINITY_DN51289_c0_g1_i1.p2  ORF type:complete len:228 (+),score=94.70 TRINITY_DN51289_c0_g1_i1:89-685(+)